MRPFWRKKLARTDVFGYFVPSTYFILLVSFHRMAEESANIYRVNKLLEIEVADWHRQLERAVSGFLFTSQV